MTEVHALRCDRCSQLGDLVEVVDRELIELAESMDVEPPMTIDTPAGWLILHVQGAPVSDNDKASGPLTYHFCGWRCATDFMVDRTNVPPAFLST
jgi:hypothetical protein